MWFLGCQCRIHLGFEGGGLVGEGAGWCERTDGDLQWYVGGGWF